MMDYEPTDGNFSVPTSTLAVDHQGISSMTSQRTRSQPLWGGIVGGAVVGLSLQLALASLLIAGAAHLASAPCCTADAASPGWLSAGVSLAGLLLSCTAAFVGAWFATRLAAVTERLAGLMHGVLVAALMTLVCLGVTLFLLAGLIKPTDPLASRGETQPQAWATGKAANDFFDPTLPSPTEAPPLASQAIAGVALWTCLMILGSLIAGGLGGWAGTCSLAAAPRQLPIAMH